TGVIYRQFSITIVSAMGPSVLVALVLSPALTSTLLKPKAYGTQNGRRRFARFQDMLERAKYAFNTRFDRASASYAESVAKVVDRKWLFLAIYALAVALLVLLYFRLPGGFLPNEDQGRVAVQFRLPAGATQERTLEVRDAIEKYLLTQEKANTQGLFLIAGGGGGGASGQNTGQGYVNLVDWDDRPGPENTA